MNPDELGGKVYTLTGAMAVDGPKLAKAAAEAIGHNVEYKNISVDEARSLIMGTNDLSDNETEAVLEAYSWVRAGKMESVVSQQFEELCGHPPLKMAEFFQSKKAELQQREE
jgi:uncharacterized protein YbjT (DUF2867 family)